MKKGILFVPFMTGWGGTETVIHNLFEAINRFNDQHFLLTVYSLGGSIDYNWAKDVNINVQKINKKRKIRTIYYATILPFKMWQIINKEKPDFIISTNPIMWTLAKLCTFTQKTPIIAWYHYSLRQKPVNYFLLHSADYFLAISSGIRNELITKGIPSGKIYLILNPISSNSSLIPQIRKPAHFIYLGRADLDGQKNMHELLNALDNLKGNWLLDIYGSEKDSKPVKDYAARLNISKHLIWHGFVNKPWNNIQQATALILTSKYEGLPMVLCEAISHGVYCVSANMPTGPDDIINSQNGKLYQLGNVKELTGILQSIIDDVPLPSPKSIYKTSSKFFLSNYLKRFDKAIDSITK